MKRVWLAFVVGCLCSAILAADKKPNVLLIYADDVGWGDVGFNGRTEWQTPHLDKLAAQGACFKRWYTGAVVCAPSRAVLLTGKHTIHNGVSANDADLPAEEVTLAEALKANGYATALFGKWHHGRKRPGKESFVHPMDQGFDEFFGFVDAIEAWEHFPKELNAGRGKQPASGYADTQFADKTIDFLGRHKDAPFFVYLALTTVHFHVEAPEADVAEFKGKFKEREAGQPVNAAYAAMLTRMDKEIGRVLKALDDNGLANDTLVIFSSDHGATFEAGNKGAAAFHNSNRPFRGQKRTLFEGGIRVPGVVRWPGKVPAGTVSQEIVHMTDVFPTVLSAVGVKADPAWKLDGRDMLGVWQGRDKAPERTLFWEWRVEGSNVTAAMRGNFKLIAPFGQPLEMYDVDGDPSETRNIVGDHPELAKQLRKEIDEWLASETEASSEGRAKKALEKK